MILVFWNTPICFAIPVGLHRPQIGPPARNGKKNGRRMDFGKRGKMAERWGNWPKNGSKMVIFPFFGHFSPFSPVGPKSIFWPFFSPNFGPEARFGVCTGQSGSQDLFPFAPISSNLFSEQITTNLLCRALLQFPDLGGEKC